MTQPHENRRLSADPNASQRIHSPNPAQGAYFPLRYYVGLLNFLAGHPDLFNIITYDDLPWNGDLDFRNNYPTERSSWQRYVTNAPAKDKVHVLIQHDVDSKPQRTLELLKHEENLGIPSNIMVFNRRIDRKALKHYARLQYTNYDIDIPYLRHLESQGFVIGYHTNAVEQASWNLDAATRYFREDVEQLASNFQIRYFSPHGGVPSPEGMNNRDIPIPDDLSKSVRWVHNRFTPRFDGNYSDGGINNPKRDIRKRDLRDFVSTWKRGCRYRILIHPQYYDDDAQAAQHLKVAAWYTRLFHQFHEGNRTGWERLRFHG